MANGLDDQFKDFAVKYDSANRQPGSFSSASNFGQREYEAPIWKVLVPEEASVLRIVGGVPNSGVSSDTAREVIISWIRGDDGRKFKYVRRAEDLDDIISRVIRKVNALGYSGGKRCRLVQESHPDIYNIVNKNGLKEDDEKFRFERGWLGQKVVIANVIDREDPWCATNKHTKLLAKSASESSSGGLFISEGIPSFGFMDKITNLFRSYGSWENYDIAITRHGSKENPYSVINAGKHIEEIFPEEKRQYVSTLDHLTDEEQAYERYDLNKLFGPTSVTKLSYHLRNTLKKIDAALGTTFSDELKAAVDVEKKKREEAANKEMLQQATQQTVTIPTVENTQPAPVASASPAPVAPTAPTRNRTAAPAPTQSTEGFGLPNWNLLTPEEKNAVIDAHKDGMASDGVHEHWTAHFKDTGHGADQEALAACPSCETAAPLWFTHCPACGAEFS